MGYYQIVSSELDMDPLKIIDKYHVLKQIEDQFRAMKGTLDTRPVFVRRPEHIAAHLTICLIALIVTRIIPKRIADHEKTETKEEDKDTVYWSFGMSADRVQTALNKWMVEIFPNDLYRFTNINDPDLKRIPDAFGIDLPRKLYSRAEVKQLKTKTEIFI